MGIDGDYHGTPIGKPKGNALTPAPTSRILLPAQSSSLSANQGYWIAHHAVKNPRRSLLGASDSSSRSWLGSMCAGFDSRAVRLAGFSDSPKKRRRHIQGPVRCELADHTVFPKSIRRRRAF